MLVSLALQYRVISTLPQARLRSFQLSLDNRHYVTKGNRERRKESNCVYLASGGKWSAASACCFRRMTDISIRPVDAEAFRVAFEWAANEGWNPGLDDGPAFHAVDPQGFLMGYRDGKPISCISAVRHGDFYGFLGYYIVHPDHRGMGAGIATWNAGMAHLSGLTVGLDGVVEQEANYKKSGFAFSGRNIRHTGIPKVFDVNTKHIRPASAADIPKLIAYDQMFFPVRREKFVNEWCQPQAAGTRQTCLAEWDGTIVGYGTIRRCRSGYRIGPLFADTERVASDLFHRLCGLMGPGEEVWIDTPHDNSAAVSLARSSGLKPGFETVRMYKGTPPVLPISKIYGITSLTVG